MLHEFFSGIVSAKRFKPFNFCYFYFQLDKFSSECHIIQEAVNRYYKRTFPRYKDMKPFNESHPWYDIVTKEPNFRGIIDRVEVVMKNKRGCEDFPYLDMDEHCKHTVEYTCKLEVARQEKLQFWRKITQNRQFSAFFFFSEALEGGIKKIGSGGSRFPPLCTRMVVRFIQ